MARAALSQPRKLFVGERGGLWLLFGFHELACESGMGPTSVGAVPLRRGIDWLDGW